MANGNKPKPEIGSLAKDVVFPAGPQDTISSVCWSPAYSHVAATSWDGKVYIYDVAQPSNIRGLTTISNPTNAPFLDCDFNKEGTLVAAACADMALHVLDAATGQTHTWTGHTKPIRTVRFVSIPNAQAPIVATGSWDKTLRYWDLRQPQPAAVVSCGERVYAMDTTDDHLVLSTADNNLHVFDLSSNPSRAAETWKAPWKTHTTCLAVSKVNAARVPNAASDVRMFIVMGGIEGRAAVQSAKFKGSIARNVTDYTFKCHRETTSSATKKPITTTTNVYTINTIAFYPSPDTPIVATGGSDGAFTFWDIVHQSRRRQFPKVSDGAVTSCTFSSDGAYFVYAVGYDWTRGCNPQPQGGRIGQGARLVLHGGVDGDVKSV